MGDHIPPNKLAAQTAGLLPDSLASFLREPLGYLQKQRKGRYAWLTHCYMQVLPPIVSCMIWLELLPRCSDGNDLRASNYATLPCCVMPGPLTWLHC